MSEHEQIEAARWLLRTSITEGVFPAAVVEVGSRDGVLWREAFGTITFEPSAAPTAEDTIFDLASLTKPIATTSVILQLMAEHAISVETPRRRRVFRSGAGRNAPPPRSSTCSSTRRDYRRGCSMPHPCTRREFEHDICALPLEYAPRTRSIYSDLDFILLGFLAEDRGQGTLAQQFGSILSRLTTVDPRGETDFLAFDVPAAARERACTHRGDA